MILAEIIYTRHFQMVQSQVFQSWTNVVLWSVTSYSAGPLLSMREASVKLQMCHFLLLKIML